MVDTLGMRMCIVSFSVLVLVGQVITALGCTARSMATMLLGESTFPSLTLTLSLGRIYQTSENETWLIMSAGLEDPSPSNHTFVALLMLPHSQDPALNLTASLPPPHLPHTPTRTTGRLIFGLGGECLVVGQSAFISAWFQDKEVAFALGFTLSVSRLGRSVVQPSSDIPLDSHTPKPPIMWTGRPRPTTLTRMTGLPPAPSPLSVPSCRLTS